MQQNNVIVCTYTLMFLLVVAIAMLLV